MRRSGAGFAVLLALAVLACAGLIALGVWQVHRLAWKEALIARVDDRVAAAPAPVPGPDAWPRVTAASAEYRHVRLTGHYRRGKDTLVRAATVLGSGYWLLSPFETQRGFTVLVNRGFVGDATPLPPPSGERAVTGLLRISEPHGGFLRTNDPVADRWYSRDVAAIARARGLDDAAPYFVDADAQQEAGEQPVGGLTVIRFPNNHLGYAITWFVLAAMVAGAGALLIRERVRSHKE